MDSLNQVKKMGTMGGNDGERWKRWGHPSTAEKMRTSINPAEMSSIRNAEMRRDEESHQPPPER
ncbi:MAG: hypothetical protein ACJATP_001552 [Candidatus Azotimanducaceae bacterium]